MDEQNSTAVDQSTIDGGYQLDIAELVGTIIDARWLVAASTASIVLISILYIVIATPISEALFQLKRTLQFPRGLPCRDPQAHLFQILLVVLRLL